MKILLIIGIIVFFTRFFLGKCIERNLSLCFSKLNDIYAIINLTFWILLIVILIKAVLIIF